MNKTAKKITGVVFVSVLLVGLILLSVLANRPEWWNSAAAYLVSPTDNPPTSPAYQPHMPDDVYVAAGDGPCQRQPYTRFSALWLDPKLERVLAAKSGFGSSAVVFSRKNETGRVTEFFLTAATLEACNLIRRTGQEMSMEPEEAPIERCSGSGRRLLDYREDKSIPKSLHVDIIRRAAETACDSLQVADVIGIAITNNSTDAGHGYTRIALTNAPCLRLDADWRTMVLTTITVARDLSESKETVGMACARLDADSVKVSIEGDSEGVFEMPWSRFAPAKYSPDQKG
ncbi:MAG: hypothetical protein F9K47_16595 [Burkholderiales bacterium]|nr:MAG: hypothetical protein F9K47_16595 [Burkholderiales bacterium]